jgi:predicted enzyme related to lactoylglutathione lyase
MDRIVHFEIAADNPSRAIDYYSKTFGWDIQKWAGPMNYWLISTGDSKTPSLGGAIMPKEGAPGNVILTIGVTSFEESLKKVIANGGSAVTTKSEIPGVGYFCYCKDTEGNVFGLLQPTDQMQATAKPKKTSKKTKKTESK